VVKKWGFSWEQQEHGRIEVTIMNGRYEIPGKVCFFDYDEPKLAAWLADELRHMVRVPFSVEDHIAKAVEQLRKQHRKLRDAAIHNS
jgi:hypothetical protein